MRIKQLMKLTSLLLIVAAMLMPTVADAQSHKRSRTNRKAKTTATTTKQSGLGKLNVYYATCNLRVDETSYSAGDYVADNIKEHHYISSSTANNYKLSNEYGMKFDIPKSKLTVKSYNLAQLPVSSVGQRATFVSDDGYTARIFRSSSNGHHYYDISENTLITEGGRPEGCYVVSVEYNDTYYDNYGNEKRGKVLFEEELETEGNNFKLYSTSLDKTRKVGCISRLWKPDLEKWPENRSAYDARGNLLTNLYDEPIENQYSIAYIADQDALYFEGKLYYRQKSDETKSAISESKTQKEDIVYKSVEQMPQYPGGEAALMRYIASNIQYPTMAQENHVQGKVLVQAVVKKDGSIGEVKVVRSVDPYLDKEAIRVIQSIPHRFIPGRQNGEPVDVWYTFSVNFKTT